MKRRDFVKTVALSAGAASVPSMFSCANKNDKLNILVLGGTFFVGPAIVRAALGNGHQVTLFNRGITHPDLFPTLKLIKGDREKAGEAYTALKSKKWDVVIDVWPQDARLVDDATMALANHTDHYIYISSIAVYNNFQEVGLHENSKVVDLNLERTEWAYPEEKLAAENKVRERFPGNHTILRCGAIKGWRDPALDLLYWCVKLNRESSVIAPGSGNDPLQFVDVKDVGRSTIMAAENKWTGTYNCLGPTSTPLYWKDFLDIAKKHFQSKTELVWAGEDFLRENKVYSFSDLPLWAPLSEDRGFMQISNKKLVEAGFEFTPIESTLDDCMRWYNEDFAGEIKFGSPSADVGLERNRELGLIGLLKN